MKYGIVIRNCTDLRSGPKFRSERKSQLLFGEPLKIGAMRQGYCKVYQNDGYEGWVDTRALVILSEKGFRRFVGHYNYLATAGTAPVRSNKKADGTICPPFIFYGTKLSVEKCRDGKAFFNLPGGGLAVISMKNMAALSRGKMTPVKSSDIIKEVRRFLGSPYLWGGMTPYGIDCSGLVQLIYKRYGIILPRDSAEQRKRGREIKREEVKKGDLLFFKGHVAIAIDRYRIIHSSLGEGGVAENSLRPGDAGFRKDLFDTFITARRILP
ncbi:MAG: NlpC/P60 family protein [Candidatus Zixiibacteriota bacterium]